MKPPVSSITYFPASLVSVRSFNGESTFDKDTEFLIIGTLTPTDGMGIPGGPGYFYCSKKNLMYSFIDSAKSTTLVKKKENLRKEWAHEHRASIIDELRTHHIAFLDVVDKALVPPVYYKDDDIYEYTLAVKTFSEKLFKKDPSTGKRPIENPNLHIAANSLNAFDRFVGILKEIFKTEPGIRKLASSGGPTTYEIDSAKGGLKDPIRVTVIPQQLRGYSGKTTRLGRTYKTVSELQKDWEKFFK